MEQKTGLMMNREWSRDELEQSIAWLKRMNAKGNNIYVRPAGEHALVLVDDVKRSTIERMKLDGLEPAAVIETSPGNYQAWVKLSEKPLSAEQRYAAAHFLAAKYQGDKNSIGSEHYGRLAGFTNQKPERAKDGRQPYVLAQECPGKPAKNAKMVMDGSEQILDRVAAKQESAARIKAIQEVAPAASNGPSINGRSLSPQLEYKRQAKRLLAQYGPTADLSRVDWMIATDMAKSNSYSVTNIEAAIKQCSPNIESRKAGHIEDYAKRTAENAWNDPAVHLHRQQVVQAEEQRQRERDDRSGPGLSR